MVISRRSSILYIKSRWHATKEWPKLGFILEEKCDEGSLDHQFCLTLEKVSLWSLFAFSLLYMPSAGVSYQEFSRELDVNLKTARIKTDLCKSTNKKFQSVTCSKQLVNFTLITYIFTYNKKIPPVVQNRCRFTCINVSFMYVLVYLCTSF